MTVERRERDRVAEPEAVEFEREIVLRRVVDLVRHEQDGLVRGAQDLRDLLVAGRHAGPRVGDEHDEIRLLDRLAGLGGDRADDRRGVGDVDAAGVDQDEARAGPLADELLPVARHPRRLVDDGGAALRQPVHERRLADVREADDGDGAGERRLRSRLGHRGGTATAGRPAACTSTRKSKRRRISRPISAEASR